MNWEIITAVAELVGASAVVASLLYLGLQTRNSVMEDRARTMHDLASQFIDWQMTVATDPEMTKIWVNGIGDYHSLSDMEKAQFIFLGGSVCRIQENIFLQFQAGRLENAIWEPYSVTLSSVANSSGMREYIKGREGFHTKAWLKLVADKQKELADMPEMYTESIS
ncbi:MAG: hypothetical protein ACI9B8_001956 [Sulfitobacter sp.]